MNNEELEGLFKRIGERYDYKEVTAQFGEETDLKVKWQRCSDWIHFMVSDYLQDAPEEVLESIATTIMTRIKGEEDGSYSEPTIDYLTSEEFLDRNQPLYVQRNGYERSCGDISKLEGSMNRLIENGMIKAHPDMFLCWCKKDTGTVGKSSVLMKTVAMNGRLDGPLVSDDLLDFCLYSQMLMLDRGFSGSAPDKDGYLEDLNGYPGSKGFKEQLRQMGLHT